jgi:hypothetical protein
LSSLVKILVTYPYFLGDVGCGRGEHDQHVVERLQLHVIPQQPAHQRQYALKLHLVLQLTRPGGREPLLVLGKKEPINLWLTVDTL